ncbi:hypothetical protein [Thalassomonas actiniarum]|uniref:Uncharacterized protein n=1 Tax=Thalassomonas actiniarum TaxID=485447 RepID=A0AAE9YWD4_9GAMM|nr:hypothetical protein [Thalassomonas actiniarum]WDE02501.1 hypothetical protein SG35_029265 [Thalassomonas actiniarum]
MANDKPDGVTEQDWHKSPEFDNTDLFWRMGKGKNTYHHFRLDEPAIALRETGAIVTLLKGALAWH